MDLQFQAIVGGAGVTARNPVSAADAGCDNLRTLPGIAGGNRPVADAGTMTRSKSSRRWLDRHFKDPYVKRAQQAGYRSRAAFKLLEIQEKDRILAPGMTVVDLGAAPGGWSQAAAQLVVRRGCVVAMDLLEMDPLPDVTFIQGDFREEGPLTLLREALGAQAADLVLSDMAPNLSGKKHLSF